MGCSDMLHRLLHVAVHWTTHPDVNMRDLLQALHTKSKSISTAKIESARVPVTSEVGKWGKRFILGMSKCAVKNHPDVSDYTTQTMKRTGGKTAQKSWGNNNKSESEAWGACEALNTTKVLGYIKDATNRTKHNEVNKILSVESKEDNAVTMKAPYYLSCERVSQEPSALNRKPFNLTSEMRNQILAVPPIMTYVYSGLRNNTPKAVAGDERLVRLIEYTLRFHMGAESGQASIAMIHGALTAQYKIPFTAQYTVNQLEGELLVVPITICVVHMPNAYILYASHSEHG